MADALLSAFIDQLTSAIIEIAKQEVRLIKEASDAIENLKKNLGVIKAVLKDAEKRQWTEDSVKIWVDELTDVSYDLDQVLDEWNTAILKSEIDDEEAVAAQNVSLCRKLKVRLSALCRCFHSGPLVRVVHRRNIASKIEHLNSRVERIWDRKDKLNFSLTSAGTDNPIRSNTTTSFVEVSTVFGQDTYKKNLIDRLLSQDGQKCENLQIIPVVGMGGIGKTTLAKVVFNDDKVKSHFDKRIWVCVSDPFDIVKIVTEIVQQLTEQPPPSGGLQVLMQSLIASIEDKKKMFLLVLDDVWIHDYLKWEQLEKPLLRGSVGSRVIVTTRKVEVAMMMGVQDNFMIRIEELSERDSWLLFSEFAFSGKTEEAKGELEGIGKEISAKCNGLPLAVKTLGSLLRIKRTKEEWSGVLHSDLWNLEKVKENLFYPLLLSYFDLSPIEKRCFSYCAIFPKDHKLEKDDLIRMWMAQGYFDSVKHEDCWDTSERCFENLAMRSFFQDFRYQWKGSIYFCKMHDIVNDFALFLTTNEHCSFVKENLQEKVTVDTRHLILLAPSLPFVSNTKSLRSLWVYDIIVDQSAIDLCLRFTSLRMLILKVTGSSNLECIGDLVHLRYLDLECNDEPRELPHTLGNLCNMQSLILKGFSLPKEVAKLTKLRYLDCFYSLVTLCSNSPKGIVRLKDLQGLAVVLCSSRAVNIEENFELGDLSYLNRLRYLTLWNLGIDEGHVEGARRAQLLRKQDIFQLALFFHHTDVSDSETHKNTLEALQPPPNLKLLLIYSYNGSVISPSWMSSSSSLVHLKILILRNFSNCKTLPPLGKLQSLETLKITDMKRVNKVGPEFLGEMPNILEQEEYNINAMPCSSSKIPTTILFPKLERLYFDSMASWTEWVGIQGWNKGSTTLKIMPCLETLEFFTCKELEALPEFLETTPLKELIIKDSPKLKSACQEERGKEWSKIQHVPIIKFIN